MSAEKGVFDDLKIDKKALEKALHNFTDTYGGSDYKEIRAHAIKLLGGYETQFQKRVNQIKQVTCDESWISSFDGKVGNNVINEYEKLAQTLQTEIDQASRLTYILDENVTIDQLIPRIISVNTAIVNKLNQDVQAKVEHSKGVLDASIPKVLNLDGLLKYNSDGSYTFGEGSKPLRIDQLINSAGFGSDEYIQINYSSIDTSTPQGTKIAEKMCNYTDEDGKCLLHASHDDQGHKTYIVMNRDGTSSTQRALVRPGVKIMPLIVGETKQINTKALTKEKNQKITTNQDHVETLDTQSAQIKMIGEIGNIYAEYLSNLAGATTFKFTTSADTELAAQAQLIKDKLYTLSITDPECVDITSMINDIFIDHTKYRPALEKTTGYNINIGGAEKKRSNGKIIISRIELVQNIIKEIKANIPTCKKDNYSTQRVSLLGALRDMDKFDYIQDSNLLSNGYNASDALGQATESQVQTVDQNQVNNSMRVLNEILDQNGAQAKQIIQFAREGNKDGLKSYIDSLGLGISTDSGWFTGDIIESIVSNAKSMIDTKISQKAVIQKDIQTKKTKLETLNQTGYLNQAGIQELNLYTSLTSEGSLDTYIDTIYEQSIDTAIMGAFTTHALSGILDNNSHLITDQIKNNPMLALYSNIHGVGSALADKTVTAAKDFAVQVAIQVAIAYATGGIGNAVLKSTVMVGSTKIAGSVLTKMTPKIVAFFVKSPKLISALSKTSTFVAEGAIEGAAFHATGVTVNNAISGTTESRWDQMGDGHERIKSMAFMRALKAAGGVPQLLSRSGNAAKPLTAAELQKIGLRIEKSDIYKGPTKLEGEALTNILKDNNLKIAESLKSLPLIPRIINKIKQYTIAVPIELGTMMGAEAMVNFVFQENQQYTTKDLAQMIGIIIGMKLTGAPIWHQQGGPKELQIIRINKIGENITSMVVRNKEGKEVDIVKGTQGKENVKSKTGESGGKNEKTSQKEQSGSIKAIDQKIHEMSKGKTISEIKNIIIKYYKKEIISKRKTQLEKSINTDSNGMQKLYDLLIQKYQHIQNSPKYKKYIEQGEQILNNNNSHELSMFKGITKMNRTDIYKLQEILGLKGSDVDGIFGRKTLEALQKYIQKSTTETDVKSNGTTTHTLQGSETSVVPTTVTKKRIAVEKSEQTTQNKEVEIKEGAKKEVLVQNPETGTQNSESKTPIVNSIANIGQILEKGNIITIDGKKYSYQGLVGIPKGALFVAKKGVKGTNVIIQNLSDLATNRFNLEPGSKKTNEGRNAKLQKLLAEDAKAEAKEAAKNLQEVKAEAKEVSSSTKTTETKTQNDDFNKAAEDIVAHIFDTKPNNLSDATSKIEQFGAWLGKTTVGPTLQLLDKAKLWLQSIKIKFPDIGLTKQIDAIIKSINNRYIQIKINNITAMKKSSDRDKLAFLQKADLNQVSTGELSALYELSGGIISSDSANRINIKSKTQGAEPFDMSTLRSRIMENITAMKNKIDAEPILINHNFSKTPELKLNNQEITLNINENTTYVLHIGQQQYSIIKEGNKIYFVNNTQKTALNINQQYTIGRGHESLTGAITDHYVSKDHMEIIVKDNNNIIIKDKNSANGTTIKLTKQAPQGGVIYTKEVKGFEQIQKSKLAQGCLQAFGRPIHKIAFGENTLYTSQILKSNQSGKSWIIGYTQTGEIRYFYKSGSEGEWRSCPGKAFGRTNRLSKAESINNASYETTTKVDAKIGAIFDTFQTKAVDQSPHEIITDLAKKNNIGQHPGTEVLLDQMIQEVDIEKMFADPTIPTSAVDFYQHKKCAEVAKAYKKLQIPGLEYQNMIHDTSLDYTFTHELLGTIQVYVMKMNFKGKPVYVHFASAKNNNPNDIFITNIVYADAKINSFGIYDKQINAGPLVAKPLDYKEQAPSDLNNNRPGMQGSPRSQEYPLNNEGDSYSDIRFLYQENPLIKSFKNSSVFAPSFTSISQ